MWSQPMFTYVIALWFGLLSTGTLHWFFWIGKNAFQLQYLPQKFLRVLTLLFGASITLGWCCYFFFWNNGRLGSIFGGVVIWKSHLQSTPHLEGRWKGVSQRFNESLLPLPHWEVISCANSYGAFLICEGLWFSFWVNQKPSTKTNYIFLVYVFPCFWW